MTVSIWVCEVCGSCRVWQYVLQCPNTGVVSLDPTSEDPYCANCDAHVKNLECVEVKPELREDGRPRVN